MNAAILAGGFGNRLMPFTTFMPKPMLNVANFPMIDYTVSQLTNFGIRNIVFALAYKPEKIIEWTIGYKNVLCGYSIENEPLGTCGAIAAILENLDEVFFVLSGDGISDIDLSKMYKTHRDKNADITIAVTAVRNPSLYGVVDVDDDGMIRSFIEKPQNNVKGSYINCGLYLINKNVFKDVSNTKCDFAKDLFPAMLGRNQKLAAYIHAGYWNDVGSMESFFASNMEIKNNGAFFPYEKNIFRKNFAGISNTVNNCLIGKTAEISGTVVNSVIGNNCVVTKNSIIENSIILDNSIANGVYRDCIFDGTNTVKISQNSLGSPMLQNSTNNFERIFPNS